MKIIKDESVIEIKPKLTTRLCQIYFKGGAFNSIFLTEKSIESLLEFFRQKPNEAVSLKGYDFEIYEDDDLETISSDLYIFMEDVISIKIMSSSDYPFVEE